MGLRPQLLRNARVFGEEMLYQSIAILGVVLADLCHEANFQKVLHIQRDG